MTEIRHFDLTEIRAGGDDNGHKIEGYAAVFGLLSVPLWGFRERIAQGAFAGTLNDDIRALWNHNTDYPLGRTTAQTLRLAEDDHGLAIAIDLPNTTAGNDAHESIKRGDVSQMSFMFRALDDEWDEEDGELIRTVKKVKLYEVSPVTFPAYPQTSVSARGQYLATLGDKIEMPAQFRAKYGGNDAERARARLAMKRRQLDLLSRQGS